MNPQTAPQLPLTKLIRERHSVRSFDTGRPISEEDLRTILEAGRLAPSATNAQPWHFYHLKSEEAREKICSCYKPAWFADAAEVILIVGNEDEPWTFKDGRNNALYIDSAIATAYMQLQAWELGIGSVWICAFDRPRCAELFGLKMGEHTPISILALGYPSTDHKPGKKVRKPLTEVLTTL